MTTRRESLRRCPRRPHSTSAATRRYRSAPVRLHRRPAPTRAIPARSTRHRKNGLRDWPACRVPSEGSSEPGPASLRDPRVRHRVRIAEQKAREESSTVAREHLLRPKGFPERPTRQASQAQLQARKREPPQHARGERRSVLLQQPLDPNRARRCRWRSHLHHFHASALRTALPFLPVSLENPGGRAATLPLPGWAAS